MRMTFNFPRTRAFEKISAFIKNLRVEKNETNTRLHVFLHDIMSKIKNTNLSKEPSRFANINAIKIHDFIQSYEIYNPYIKSAFGNRRLDYGTGHELNFYCALFCENIKGNIFPLINLYYRTVIFFIRKFKIEPAGSKGFWGVDDYFILAFFISLKENPQFERVDEFLTGDYLLKILVDNLVEEKRAGTIMGLRISSPFIYSFVQKTREEAEELIMQRIMSDLFNSHVVMQHFIFSSYLEN